MVTAPSIGDLLEAQRAAVAAAGERTLDIASETSASELVATLRLVGPTPELDRYFVLEPGAATIGRSDSCDVFLRDPGISRKHAQIRVVGQGLAELHDLGSNNGSYVNGQRISTVPLVHGDRLDLGAATHLVFEQKEPWELSLDQQLRHESVRDGLTGTYKKAYLLQRLQELVSAPAPKPRAVNLLMMDLDHFKAVNDTYGHAAGDEVLQVFADVAAASTRPGEVLARYGGEEFALLTAGLAPIHAHAFAERLRVHAERAEAEVDGNVITITVSIGVVTLLAHAQATADALIRAADEALYRAKAAGRNRVVSVTLGEGDPG